MIYAEQIEGFGLGNFINLTPTLKEFNVRGEKVKVFFSDEKLKECFLDCPFIEIVNHRLPESIHIHSGMICRSNDKPDYQFVWEKFFGKTKVKHHTYIDTPDSSVQFIKPYVVVINGSGPERLDYVQKKKIDPNHYNNELKKHKGKLVVGVGSEKDKERLNGVGVDYFETGLRQCLSVIKNADAVISNDCGLAHAAGAMNKDLTIFWKETKIPKNLNPGKFTKNIRI